MVFWESEKETVRVTNSNLSTTKHKWIGRYLKLTSLFITKKQCGVGGEGREDNSEIILPQVKLDKEFKRGEH